MDQSEVKKSMMLLGKPSLTQGGCDAMKFIENLITAKLSE